MSDPIHPVRVEAYRKSTGDRIGAISLNALKLNPDLAAVPSARKPPPAAKPVAKPRKTELDSSNQPTILSSGPNAAEGEPDVLQDA
jgi:hypothetical protein